MPKIVIIEYDILREMIKAEKENKISATDFVTAMDIISYRNWKTRECFPSVPTLADDRGIDKRNIYEHLRSLKDVGFISNIKGGKNPDGTKYSSRYEFHLPKEPEKENNVVDVVEDKPKEIDLVEYKKDLVNRAVEAYKNSQTDKDRINAVRIVVDKRTIEQKAEVNKDLYVLAEALHDALKGTRTKKQAVSEFQRCCMSGFIHSFDDYPEK